VLDRRKEDMAFLGLDMVRKEVKSTIIVETRTEYEKGIKMGGRFFSDWGSAKKWEARGRSTREWDKFKWNSR